MKRLTNEARNEDYSFMDRDVNVRLHNNTDLNQYNYKEKDHTFDIVLNKKQDAIINSNKAENYYISGLGGGKTFTIGHFVLKNILIPDSIILLAAPTYDVLKNATWQGVQKALEQVGIMQGMHYIVNKRPPKHWGIKPYSSLNNMRVATFRTGSYVLLGNMSNPDFYRGAEFDAICVDEYRDCDDEARDILLGRLRGINFKKRGLKHRILFATTPPDDPQHLKHVRDFECKKNPDILFVHGTSFDNEANLSAGYLDRLMYVYDKYTYEREVLASLDVTSSRQFAYAFDEQKHVSPDAVYNPEIQEVVLSFDFNVDPITCCVFQYGWNDNNEEFAYQIDEFRLRNSNLYDLCDAIQDRYPESHFLVTGDATGQNRNVALRENMNYYHIIRSQLGLSPNAFYVRKANEQHRNSRVLVNSVLQHYPDFKISPKCRYTREDLMYVEVDEKGRIDKSVKERGHLLDGFRYFIDNFLSKWFKQQGSYM